MSQFRLGFQFSAYDYEGVAPRDLFKQIGDVAAALEQAGFDSLWVPDHVHQNNFNGGSRKSMLESYTLLGALATRTEKMTLGACVSPVTFRLPTMLAKTIVTLDVISGGRAVLGLGAGWDVDEHSANAIPFPGLGERFDILEEQIEICQGLLAEKEVDYDGAHYQLKGALTYPTPLQAKVPLMVAGSGEKRTLALVAKYADACNVEGDAEVLAHKFDVLRKHCETFGRNYDEIIKTSGIQAPDDADEVARMAAAQFDGGVDGLVLMSPTSPSPATVTAWGKALDKAIGR